MTGEVHIAGLVVHALAQHEASVRAALDRLTAVNVAGSDKGKIVVTVEATSDRELMDRVDAMRALPNVINAALVYHRLASPEEIGEETGS